MDGNLPAIYELCAAYKVPILLHIDPPFGEPIIKLEEALRCFSDTVFIFGHANVFNPPKNIENLLSRYNNLYVDFFAGFTVYDPSNDFPLVNYIPLIKKYSERILLSTDSATAQNLDYAKAINAMYEVIELCEDNAIAERIGRLNFLELIEVQPATKSQIALLQSHGIKYDPITTNKRIANELILGNHLV
ncbi:hypothetical protein C8Z91_24470 [Paenibacillus elgii]|uniref:Uncharacterized protein n=2 Tax=Paenibacillus elgii TaxID=189691 RepID=A0A2T6FXE0_9BACL|nr:hypothetical protein C8Z91_24470 [Paenibacillus elgii]